MKKIILFITASFTLSFADAQILIQQDTTGPNVAGTIIDLNVDQFTQTPYEPKFYVTNNSGSDQQLRVTRVKQSVPSTWQDFICWPPQCYPADGDVYTTPSSQGNPAPTIVNGTHYTTTGFPAELKPQINPDWNNAVAIYMYYITDNNGNYIDSVGVRVNFVLGLNEELPEMNISISPNPASSYITIECEEMKSGRMEIIDVLGNTISTEEIIGSSKTLDLSTFKNGIYFVRLENDDHKSTTRKIIVKH